MFFMSVVTSAVLVGVALSVHEKQPTKWTMRLVWLSLLNVVFVCGINLMYALATWWK